MSKDAKKLTNSQYIGYELVRQSYLNIPKYILGVRRYIQSG